MSRRHQLEQLLRNPRIWKAGQSGGRRRQSLPTGFPGLDAALSGGWPVGQLIELLLGSHGIGELRLLVPALTRLAGVRAGSPGQHGAGKWLALIAPPYIPYAPALADQGLNTSWLLVAHCHRPQDILWATEQALYSHACAAVLAWPDGMDELSLRRLQLAAEADGDCLCVLFRPLRTRLQRSPAALRIQLRPGMAGTTDLYIFKNRGGRPQTVAIDSRSGARASGG